MIKECFECGAPATEDHHVIPQSLGGTKTIPLCGCCHNRVHDAGWKRRDNHAELTKEGLKRAKARGVTLGNKTNLAEASLKGRDASIKAANDFAINIYSEKILPLRQQGATLYRVAMILNEEGCPTIRGKLWTVQSVHNTESRAKLLSQECLEAA